MKARVKHNNEIIDVIQVGTRTHLYDLNNVEIIDEPDYWTKLEHQYAGMAMQGLVTRGEVLGSSVQEIARDIAEISCEIAHALVEKMKEERK